MLASTSVKYCGVESNSFRDFPAADETKFCSLLSVWFDLSLVYRRHTPRPPPPQLPHFRRPPITHIQGSLLDMVTKTEVIIRGLYHADASDLDISLLHQQHSCVLSASVATTAATSSRPAGVQFGVPEERRYMNGFGPNPGGWVGGRGGGVDCTSGR